MSAPAVETHPRSPSRHGATAIVVSSEAARLQRANGVRERDRQRAACELHVRDTSPAQRGTGGRELAVEAETDDGHPVDPLERRVVVLLGEARRELPGRVRERDDVRGVLRREPEAAGEVRVEDVEAPEPSSSWRACTLTSTTSPSSTGPVSRG